MESSTTGNGNRDQNAMNAIADVTVANRLAKTLEDAEARRLGLRLKDARVIVARRLGVPPSTLEHIRRLRAKIIPNWLMARIRAEFVAVLQHEIIRLEHEIHLARQAGTDHRDDDLAKAAAQVVTAKAILQEALAPAPSQREDAR